MEHWSRIVNTTIREYSREEEVNILRNRKVLAMFRERGRISFNHAGEKMDWKVRYKRAPMTGYADSDVLSFSRRDRWKTAYLDWRGYASTDSMTKVERLVNKNTEAIVNVYSGVAKHLMEDMEENFGDECYIDGNATGNSKRVHGIESFMGDTGTGAAAGFIVPPSDTYANLSTILGNEGGSWSVNGSAQVEWPTGTGDAQYDYWSPLIVDYTDTAWSPTTKTWQNTCKEALRYGIVKGRRNRNRKGGLDVITLNDELYRQFLNKCEDQERLNVQRGDKQGLYALGFTDVINFEGVDITSEYGMPSSLGYGWSFENSELCSLQPQLFVPEGPDFDIATQSWRFSLDFFGNFKFNPRAFTKWVNRT